MPIYTLYLSGPPMLVCDEDPITGFESDKAVALLAYLALHDRPLARNCLAAMFWCELEDKRAR